MSVSEAIRALLAEWVNTIREIGKRLGYNREVSRLESAAAARLDDLRRSIILGD